MLYTDEDYQGNRKFCKCYEGKNTEYCSRHYFCGFKREKVNSKAFRPEMTLHQATRSEKLVDLFIAAGGTTGVDTVKRVELWILVSQMMFLGNMRKTTTCISQGCSLGLERLGLETVSRRFFECLGLVSIPSLQILGLVSVSASYVSFT